MLSFNFGRWLKSVFRTRGRTIEKRPRYRLSAEVLEDRLAPTVYTWTGNSAATSGPSFNKWSDGLNWQGNAPPTVGAPVQLLFQNSGTSFFTADNDIPGLMADQITFASGTFTLTGSQTLRLANPSSNTASIIVSAGAANQVMALNIQLGTAIASNETITVQPSGSLTISGQLSGNSATQLSKDGVGTLTLTADNSNFRGPFAINNAIGNGNVILTNPLGLGASLTSSLQSFRITGATSASTKYTFTYPDGITNPTTPEITFTGNAADATTIQGTLNTLFNGLGFTGSPVVVTQTAAGSGSATYSIDFTGSMAGRSVLQLNSTRTAGTGTVGTSVLALGGAPNYTTVNLNTRLQVNTPGATVTNPLIVSGAGTDNFLGVVTMTVPGVSTLAGNIQMNSNSTFGTIAGATLNITGSISDVGSFNLTKEGAGALYLDPRVPISATNNFHGGNTYRGNTNINNGILQIGHSYALGAGGARTFVNTNINETGTFALNFTNNPTIPAQFLNFAQVQTLTLGSVIAGTTQFTLSYNGVATPVLTFTNTAFDALAIETALNALATINGIGANVTVTGSGTNFNVTFGGSLGGLEIPMLTATVVSPFGTGTVTVGSVSGTAPLGFKVPDQYLTVNNPTPVNPPAIIPDIVARAVVTNGGTGYAAPPTVLFSGGGGGFGAAGFATVAGGVVTGVVLTSGGVGYTVAPTITLVGGGGVGALATAILADTGEFVGAQISGGALIGGGGYTSPPTVTFTGGLGTGMAGIATINAAGAVSSVIITDPGVGYTTPPTVTFTGGGGTGAAAFVTLLSTITASFTNAAGHNSWLQPATNRLGLAPTFIGSPPAITLNAANAGTGVDIGVEQNTNLTIEGTVTSTTFLDKVDYGRLILSSVNSITSGVRVFDGALNIRDSQAPGSSSPAVSMGASLELQADGIPDSVGIAGLYNLYFPSSQSFSVVGGGLHREGAIYNMSGVNRIDGGVTLSTFSKIGVAPDPDPLNIQQATWNNLSQLTLNGVVRSTGTANFGTLTKVGYGELVLTNANTYTGPTGQNQYQTYINEGWITAKNNLALGSVAYPVNTLDKPGAKVASGAALVLTEDLGGNYLRLSYNLTIAGSGITHRFPWLDQMGALLNLDGANAVTGDIYLDGAAGIGVEVDGANTPYAHPSELLLTGGIHDYIGPGGQLLKLGTQRLIIQGAGTYTGGVDILGGVLHIQNDTALGLGSTTLDTTTTVRTGAALELGSTVATLNGGIERGLQVWYNHLILNGSGNALFGDAPLMVAGNDNLWRGPITLNSNLVVEFTGPAAGVAVPTMITTVNSPTGGTVSAVTSTIGGSGINAVQTLTFDGTFVGGDTFTLVVNNGTTAVQTGPIAWNANVNLLIANIQNALNAPAIEALFTAGLSFAKVALLSPVINILPNARLVATGAVGDGTIPSDISIAGGGELNLAGTNTYRGTTYLDQGILTIQNSKSLGNGITSQVQTITLNGATPSVTQFRLRFNGFETAPITYTNTLADVTNIQIAVNALNSVFNVGGSISVAGNLANPTSPIFTFTLNGALAGFSQPLITVPSITGGTATPFVLTTGVGGTHVADGSQLQLQGGITVVGEPIVLAGQGNPLQTEVQHISINAPIYGSFQLTFTNPNPAPLTSTTASLPVGASAAQVEAALNALPAIQAGDGTGGGSVTVTRDGLTAYTVIFEGSFFGSSQPWSKQAVTVTGTSGTFDVNFTGFAPKATVVVGATQAATLTSLQAALDSILLDLDAPGGGTGTASVALTSTGEYLITFGGSLADVAVPLLQSTNFTGTPLPTTTIKNQAWLTASAAQQLISTSGAAGGTFNVNFAGFAPTANVTIGATNAATRANLQTAINNLLANASSPGGGLGTATVDATLTGNYIVTFGGSLTGLAVPTLVVGTFTGGAGAGVNGTGSTASVGEVIQGGTTNATPTQWFSSGPSPVSNGAVNLQAATKKANISGSITSVITDPTDANIIYIATAGGGAWKTYDAGNTWAPLFDGVSTVQSFNTNGANPATDTYTLTYTDPFTGTKSTSVSLPFNAPAEKVQSALNSLVGLGNSVAVSQVIRTAGVNATQRLTFNNSTTIWTPAVADPIRYTRFRLSFNGVSTGDITYAGNANQDALNIQNALNAPGVLPPGGFVTVSVLATAPDESFLVTFGGTLASSVQPLINFSIGGPSSQFWAPNPAPSPFPTINAVPAVGNQDTGTLVQVTSGAAPSYTNTVTFSGGKLANVNVAPLITQGVASSIVIASPLIHAYELNGTFTDALGGSPLIPTGGTISATDYSFSAVANPNNEGLSLSGGLASGTNYSIEMVFRFDTIPPSFGSNFARIIDFKNRALDTGLYVNGDALTFFNQASGSGGTFQPGVDVHLVITRDGTTNQFSAYINGGLEFTFTDTANEAVFTGPGNIIHFFIDDNSFFQDDVADGAVDKIRTYNRPLTLPEVITLAGGGTLGGSTSIIGLGVGAVDVTSGAGYTAPNITFTSVGGVGSGAAGTVVGLVSGVAIGAGGSGYTSAPSVSFVGGGGTGATGTASILGGSVIGVNITNPGTGYTSAPSVVFTGGGFTTPATATSSLSITDVVMTSLGTGYVEPPNVVITDPTGAGATAYAHVDGGRVSDVVVSAVAEGAGAAGTYGIIDSIQVLSGGTGYSQVSTPTVTITGGGGTGATAVANVLGGRVTSISITNPGSGYTSEPTVTISGGVVGNAGATAIAKLGVLITASGSGYTSAPTVSFTGGGGSGASGLATIVGGRVTRVVVTDPGSGYSTLPTVSFTPGFTAGTFATFSGGGGTGAAANVTVVGGAVTRIDIISSGTGYTSAPTITITGGGINATATASVLFGGVVAVNITNGGFGYTATPIVTVATGGGSGAKVEATIEGTVTGGAVTNPGVGYFDNPTITIDRGDGGDGAEATAMVTAYVRHIEVTDGGAYITTPRVEIQTDFVSQVVMVAGLGPYFPGLGSGYDVANPPTVTLVGGGGFGATATANLDTVVFQNITITNGGSGYSGIALVSFVDDGGTGSGATGTVQLAGGQVVGITVTNRGTGYTGPITVNIFGNGMNAAAVATTDTIVSSITVTNGGNGYTSNPTVFISGPGAGAQALAFVSSGAGARAFANMSGSTVASVTVTDGGRDYDWYNPPRIAFIGGGAIVDAVANGVLDGGVFDIIPTGGGFTAPTVTFTGGGATTNATATVTGSVTAIQIIGRGAGVNANPPGNYSDVVGVDITFTGGGGSGAKAVAYLDDEGRIASIAIRSGGSGYTSPPTISFSDPLLIGYGASAVCTLSPTEIVITNPGAGYTSPPTVTFNDPTGSLASVGGIATINRTTGELTGVLITTGSDYSSAPTIFITGGSVDVDATAAVVFLTSGANGATGESRLNAVVTAMNVAAQGSDYTSQPIVVFNGAGGAPAIPASPYRQLPVLQQGINSKIAMFGGAIAIDPARPNILYFGTGEGNNSHDSFYGSGVYRSTDFGETWSLLTDPSLPSFPGDGAGNPLYGFAINKIVVDSPNNIIYVATSDLSANGLLGAGTTNTPYAHNAGVWRYDLKKQSWFNLTNLASVGRVTGRSAQNPNALNSVGPGTPGPDDNYNFEFPQQSISWTDLALSGGNLYAALGTAESDFNNVVYHLTNPTTADNSTNPPLWLIGDRNLTSALDFPRIPQPNNQVENWFFLPLQNYGNIRMSVNGNTILAAIARPTDFPLPLNPPHSPENTHSFFTLLESTDGGVTWGLFGTQPPNYMASEGHYATAMLGTGTIGATYLAGTDLRSFMTGTAGGNYVLRLTAGGWLDISMDAVNNGPHTGVHSMTLAGGNLFVATDGGLWKYYLTTPPTTTTLDFVQPAVGANVTISVATTAGMAVGQPLQVTNGGIYIVAAVVNATTVTITNPGVPGNVPPTTIIFAGEQAIVPNDTTKTDAVFVQPAVGASVLVKVISSSNLSKGQTLNIVGGGYYNLDAIIDGTTILLTNLGVTGNAPAGTSIATLAIVDGANLWQNLTGNLAISQFNGLASHPTDPNSLFGVGKGISLVKYNGTQSWSQPLGIQPIGAGNNANLNGSSVAVDPNNPQIMYEWQQSLPYPNTFLPPNDFLFPVDNPIARLFESVDGGANWTFTGITSGSLLTKDAPVVVDKVSRAFAGGSGGLRVFNPPSVPTWTSLNAPIAVTAIAVAEVQGAFIVDTRFPSVTDLGATSPDPNTIYITNGASVRVTKNFGLNWIATAALPGPITDIAVDPRNRDTVYAVVGGFIGDPTTGTVWKSTNAGQSWTQISEGLPSSLGLTSMNIDDGGSLYTSVPTVTIAGGGGTGATAVASISKGVVTGITITNPGSGYTSTPNIFITGGGGSGAAATPTFGGLPAWKIVIDPRTDLLYLGTERGVYQYTTGINRKWELFGANLPQVPIHALDLNQNTNILTAGTYGRSAYQFFLDTPTVNSGAMFAASGANIWNGPVILSGDATISAGGQQRLQNGVAVTQLTVLGTISDQSYAATTNAFNTLTKIGGGDVNFAAANIYGGQTLVNQGNLVVQHPNALGAGTIAGTQQLFLNNATAGDTDFSMSFNGSTTATITYTGVAATDAINIANALNNGAMASIAGVGASVTVTANGQDSFLITFNGSLAGITAPMIIVNVTGGTGFGYSATAGGTVVADGSILQLKNSLTGEPLFLFGNGIEINGHFSGALQNLSDNNTYTGTITLETNATIGVDGTSTLTIVSPSPSVPAITDLGSGPAFSLTKENTGTLILASGSSYRGDTDINRGVLNIRHSNALGLGGTTTTVLDQAQLQIQDNGGVSTNVTNQNLVLTGSGLSGTGALLNVSGNNSWGSATAGITLHAIPSFAPQSSPAGVVVFGVTNVADTLAINGAITEVPADIQGAPAAPTMTMATGLSKVGAGALALAGANTYSGTTYVTNGMVEVRNSDALGTNKGQAIQRISTFNPGGADTFRLNFSNAATPTPNLPFGSSAAAVQAALNNLSTIGPNGVHVARNQVFTGISEVQTLTVKNARTTQGSPTLVSAVPSAGGVFTAGTRFWVVSAITAAGETTASNEVSANLSAGQRATITWNTVPGALGYKIYRSSASGVYDSTSLVTRVSGGGITTYVDTGAAAPTLSVPTLAGGGTLAAGTYYYVITSKTTTPSESVVSNERTVVVTGTDLVNLSWNAIAGANAGYNIYRTQTAGVYSPSSLIGSTPAGTTVFSDNNSALTLGTPPLPTAPLLQTRFTLTFKGTPTANITMTGVPATDAAAIQASLQALANIGAGNVAVSADPTGTVFTITFQNALQSSFQPLLVSAINSGPGGAAITEAVTGAGGFSYIYTVVFASPTLAGAQPSIVATGSNSQMTINVSTVADGGVSAIVSNGATLQMNGAAGNVSAPTGAPTQLAPVISAGGNFTVPDDYFYVVTAITPAGESLASNQQRVSLVPGQQVTISWNPVAGATSYKVFRSTTSGVYGAGSRLVNLNAPATTFLDSFSNGPVQNPPSLSAGGSLALNTYYYVITAYDANGETGFSNEITGFVTGANRQVNLSWNAVAGAAGYRVYRSTVSGGFSATSIVMDTTSLAYTDNGEPTLNAPTVLATGGTFAPGTYFYVVAAVNAAGETIASNERTAVVGLNGRVSLTWTAVTGATGYRVYRSNVTGIFASPSLVATVAGTGLIDTGTATTAGTPLLAGQNVAAVAPIYRLHLNGSGSGNNGALRNVAGTNTFAGNVVLQTSSAIGASPGTQLIVTGVVQDTLPAPISPASVIPPNLTKVGGGTVVFPSDNAYTGNTSIVAGALNIQSAQSLGVNTSARQTVTVSGSNGSFTLFVDGFPASVNTGPIVLPFAKTDLQNKLNAMLANPSAPGGGNGFVSVELENNGNVFVVTFGGSLAGIHVPLLTASSFTGSATAAIAEILAGGSSRTHVSNGATLQMQSTAGFIENSGKVLTLQGPGLNNAGALQNVGGNNTWGTTPIVLAANSSIGADGASRLFITQPITDNFQTQTITFPGGFVAGNTYRLFFDGFNTGTITYAATTAGNASAIKSALEGLLSVSLYSGTVNVSLVSGTTYRIDLVGGMSGVSWPSIASTVLSGAGSITMGAVTPGTNALGVTKVGAGFVRYDGATANAYTGLTTVNHGTLELNKTGADTAILGNLTVGDGIAAADSAIALLLRDNQVADTSNVLVRFDGLLDINGRTETVGPLTIVDGEVKIDGAGATNQLTVASLNMTGGFVTAAAAGATLALNGNATATSDAITGPARITMPAGDIDLLGATRTFTVNDGPNVSDMVLTTAIINGLAGGVGLVKAGAGRLELASGATAGQLASVTAGDLQVDAGAVMSDVMLNGATASLSGTGNVGDITGSPSPSAAAVGTVNPGNNGVAPFVGTLNSQDVLWGANTTFFVDLTAAGGNDILNVTGDIALGGAVLTGLADPAITLGQSFTIITYSGSRTSKFNHPFAADTVFIDGKKFTVDYTSTPGSVILQRALNQLQSFNVTSSKNASFYGENVFFTATAVAELGAGPLPGGLVVDFSFNSGAVVQTVPVNTTTGQATFNPQILANFSWDVGIHTVDATFRDTNASPVYANRVLTPQFQQTVNRAPINLPVTSNPIVSPTSPVFGQDVTIFANATPVTAPASPGALLPGGTVTFTLDSGTPHPVPVSGAQWTFPTAELPAGVHHVFVVYNGDPRYAATSPLDFFLPVQKDTSVITVTSTNSPTNLGQQATLNVTVTPGSGLPTTPTGTLNFYDTSITNPPLNAAPVPYSGGTVQLTTSSLTQGSHTLIVVFTDSSGNFVNDSENVTFVVNPATTQTSFVSSSPASPVYGQAVTFTISVVANPDISATFPTLVPSGNVNLYDGVISAGTLLGTGALNTATNQATITTTTTALSGGSHNIIAVYAGGGSFQTSQATQTGFVVGRATSNTVVVANPSVGSAFGQSVTFTATVTSGAGAIPVNSNVTFWDGPVNTGTNLGTRPVDGTGRASIAVTSLSVGLHTINAVFTDDNDAIFNFSDSTGTLTNYNVAATNSTTIVSAVPATGAVFGQSVQFRANVSSAAGAPPAGTHVTFWDGAVGSGINLGTGTVNGSGLATVDTTVLTVGQHTINAVFTDDNDATVEFNNSTGMLSNYVVGPAQTTTIVAASPTAGAVYGQAITLTATVSSTTAGIPAGTHVAFWDGPAGTGILLGTGVVDGSSQATITTAPTALSVGTHTINAVFVDDNDANANFASSTGTLGGYGVGTASTIITGMSSSAPTSAVGQSVTISASVATQAPSVAGVDAGTVTFRDTTTNTLLGTSPVNASGVASVNAVFSTTGTHNISAQYNGNSPRFGISPIANFTQTVLKSTTITFNPIGSPNNFFGQTLNYQVSVAGTGVPGPTGTLTISETIAGVPTTLATFAGYTGGTVSMPISGLDAGAHTLVFSYSGDTNFAPNSKTITQTVVQAVTTTTLAPLPTVPYGQSVNLQATVTSTTAPHPTSGVVTFTDTYLGVTTTLAVVNLSGSNVATFATSATQLKAGTHTIRAIYSNSGATNYASSPVTPAASQTKTQVVTKAATRSTVTTLTPATTYGTPVTFTATIDVTSAGAPGNPEAGSVSFYSIIGTTSTFLGSAALNGSNSASITTTATRLRVATHTIKATYTGSSPNYAAATTFVNHSHTVSKAGTSVFISPSLSSGSATYGKAVTFTAIVSVASGGAPGTPVGTVSFWDGPAGTGSLLRANVVLVAINSSSARAVYTTTATRLSAGIHQITAAYNGSANFATSSEFIDYEVLQSATTTKLTSSPGIWALNQAVTFTAAVTGASGGAPGFPNGTVTFDIDGVQTVKTLVSGKATLIHTFTVQGPHTVIALYNPATTPVQNFQASAAAPQTQNVRKFTSISMTSVSSQQGVTINAKVSGAGGIPTGTVEFFKNGVSLGTAAVGSNGVATIFLDLASGNHSITAVYSGDANFNTATRTQTISGKLIGRLV